MATISVKYTCGQAVTYKTGDKIDGMVTAIFIRGKGRAYEFSYCGENGPASSVCEEAELEATPETGLGYRKESNENSNCE